MRCGNIHKWMLGRSVGHANFQPGFGIGPIGVGCRFRNTQDGSCLAQGQPGKEAELDQFAFAGIVAGQGLQKIVECDQVHFGTGRDQFADLLRPLQVSMRRFA